MQVKFFFFFCESFLPIFIFKNKIKKLFAQETEGVGGEKGQRKKERSGRAGERKIKIHLN